MFSEKFINDSKFTNMTHNALSFGSELKKEEVIERLLGSNGIDNFFTKGQKGHNAYNFYGSHINGQPSVANSADCCAFTQNADMWFLFPIHKNELANVNMTEETLIYWLKFLNESEAGFDYLYFGEQKPPSHIPRAWSNTIRTKGDDSAYYWVGIAPMKINHKISYMHWIALRYAISTRICNPGYIYEGAYSDKIIAYPYFAIPRITDLLHTKFGLSKIKAFLYAHLTSRYYANHGLAYTQYMGIILPANAKLGMPNPTTLTAYPAPCVNLTGEQFKTLLYQDKHADAINPMLTSTNYDFLVKRIEEKKKNPSYNVVVIPKGLSNLNAPYAKNVESLNKMYLLFQSGKVQEFIDLINESYGIKKVEEKKEEIVLKKRTTKTRTNGREVANSKSNSGSRRRSIFAKR